MSQAKPIYKSLSALFIALTAIFAASTGYLLANPTMMTQTVIQTETQTMSYTVENGAMSSAYSVNIAYRSGIGFYLANATGWTLYILATDLPGNGTSTCTGTCIENWPAFYENNLVLPPGLNATSFTVITRPDGSRQIAYEGQPLYYFIKDKSPGDTTGQGIKNVWFACTIPQLTLHT